MVDRRAVTTPPGSLLDALQTVGLIVLGLYVWGLLIVGALAALTCPIWVWWVA